MRDVWILTRVLIKNTYRSGSRKKPKKKYVQLLAYVLLVVCMIPMDVMLFFMYKNVFDLGMTGLALQTGFLANTLMVLMTALFSFPTMFYFSDDTMVLLPLPIKPRAIVGARLVVIFFSCLTTMALFGVPLLVAYLVSTWNIPGVLWLIVQLLLTVLSCMLVLGSLTLIVMRFMPYFANKDRFNLIIGLLAIVFSLSISLGAQSMGSSSAMDDSGQQMVAMIMSLQNGGILPMAMSFFFWLQPAIESIVHFNLLQMLLSILIPIVFGLVFFWLADRLYLPSVTTAMAQVATKKKKKLDFDASSFTKSSFINEVRILIRTPAYLTNCVLSAVLLPVILTAIFLINPELKDLGPLNPDPLETGLLISGAVVCGILVTLFCGSLNPISATAISRGGVSGADFMKSIPVKFSTQLQVKVWVGTAFTVFGDLFILIPLHLLLAYPVWVDLFYAAGCLLCSYMVNWEGVFCDGIHPKLIWVNETEAVKNNYNMVFTMLIAWVVLGLLIVPGVFLFMSMQMEQAMIWYSVILVVTCLLISGIFTWLGPRMIYRQLLNK